MPEITQDSDVRVYIAELRTSHKAMEKMQDESRADQKAMLSEMSSLTKELHRLANVFSSHEGRVDKLEAADSRIEARVRTLEDIASSEKPIKEIWMNAVKAVAVAIVLGIFYAAFKATS